MYAHRWSSGVIVTVVWALLVSAPPASAQVHELASGKMPITTESEEALRLFLQGRDLAEKIRATDAHQYYRQAVTRDPDFAIAYLALANTAPTAQDFFESLERAVALTDRASEAERLMILATDAAVRDDVEAQRDHLTRLVERFPEDERAHDALGDYYFGRQEWQKAIREYERAIQINPSYSPPYNSLGYAHRSLGDYGKAEQAFQRYIELIPDEPNPYDSYAELLMKMGRFEESIAHYKKALEKDPDFVASYIGIGNNQIFMGRTGEARVTFAELHDNIARTDGERRTALFWAAVSYLHDAKPTAALEKVQAMYRIAESGGDRAAMAGDLNLMGTIRLHSGEYGEALTTYQKAVQTMDAAEVPVAVKENAHRNLLYYEARVAIARGDIETARSRTVTYGNAVGTAQIPFEVRRHHELLGRIALHEGENGKAIEELTRANRQDPEVLYLTARAYHGAGDHVKAREQAERAANFNGLSMGYALVRAKATKMVEEHS